MRIGPRLRTSALAPLALVVAQAACAQFKVVDPDGRITYTDRPPPVSSGAQVVKISPAGAGSIVAAPPGATGSAGGQALPLELRQAIARFPVTLYTMAECTLCDQGRRLLRERGVPHTEKTVDEFGTDELARLTGGRSVPTLSVGAKMMRGYGEFEWHTTLDLAGYPRESRLPRSYAHAAATPLVTRPAAAPPTPAATEPPAVAAPQPADEEPPPGGPPIRF